MLGTGACLLLSGTDVLATVTRSRDLLDQAGLRVVALGPEPGPDTVVDTTGAYTGWLQELSAAAVLIRPDFAVYGTARTPACTRSHDNARCRPTRQTGQEQKVTCARQAAACPRSRHRHTC